ncbi:MAG: DUF971 domain-containing protein [Planctomycetota bacterium]
MNQTPTFPEPEGKDTDPVSQPVELERTAQGIRIQFDDGIIVEWTATALKGVCPCATCREKRKGKEEAPPEPNVLPVLSAADAAPTRIVGMQPVGNYGYNVIFSDNNCNGIYTFELLRKAT